MSLPVAPESWRLLTIVFVDVVGSTPLSVMLDGEDYVALIDQYQAITDPIIARHDGYLGRDEGDGRFIWFGWPQTMEDDADRAVHLALDLRREMELLAAEIRAQLDVDLAVRIGVHTGEIIVREIEGSRPNLLGAAANVAAKVQAACEPGAIYVSEATANLVEDGFRLDPVEHLMLDGLDGHLELYRVVGQTEAKELQGGTELGRRRERSILADHWRLVREGEAKTVLVVGEAGMGKTTLLQGFLESFAGPVHRLEVLGDDRTQNDAFAPLLRAIEQCPALSIEDYRAGLQDAEDRDAALAQLVTDLGRSAAHQPVIVVAEDAHWLDPSTCEALGRIVSAQLPGVLTLVTSRLSSALFGHDDVLTTLPLGPLADDDVRQVIARTAGWMSDSGLEELVVRAAGNPFFATELARSSQVHETGTRRALLPHSEVPIVVQQSLRAQLDQSTSAASLASTAAVFGRRFDQASLAKAHGAIPGGSNAIEVDLDWLCQANIISQADDGYWFRHALVQQLAYDLPVRADLQERHGAVADVLIEDGTASAALIGLHLDSAGRSKEAAMAKFEAARSARVSGAFKEGLELLDRVVELLGEKPKAADSDAGMAELEMEALELRSILGAALDERTYNANPLDRARLNTLLERSDDNQAKARALTRDWASAMVMSDLRRGGGILRRLCHVSHSDPVAKTMARHFRATHMMYRGNYSYAVEPLLSTALELAEQGLQPEFRATWSTADDPVSVALSRVPPVLWVRGEWEQAQSVAAQAAYEAETIAGPWAAMAAAHVKANTALFHELAGDGHRTLQLGGEIIEVGTGPGMAFWEKIGQLHQLIGGVILEPQPERVDQLLGAARALESTARLFAPILYLEAARGHLSRQALSSANDALDGAQGIATETGALWMWAELQRLRGLATEAPDEKRSLLEEAAVSAAKQGARVIELRALADLLEVDPQATVRGQSVRQMADPLLADFPSPDQYPEFARLVTLVH